jgi:hypothetical protein
MHVHADVEDAPCWNPGRLDGMLPATPDPHCSCQVVTSGEGGVAGLLVTGRWPGQFSIQESTMIGNSGGLC